MQVILKPVSHAEFDEIIVNDSLFPIGRYEAPFASNDHEAVAKLSRRHARIFEEAGCVYIADLGSRNGTEVNGRSVQQKPTRLHRGDEISFAQKLIYQVEILGQGSAQEATSSLSQISSLTLMPEGNGDIEPIVVTRFPFLVSKTDSVFSRYASSVPKEVSYLSRRQAHIFINGDRLYVEDLGSTNGSYVNGQRLDEHATPIENGDTIAFGGEYFTYKVLAQKEETVVTRQMQANAVPIEDTGFAEAKTTFVSSATSFLDIFCIEDDAESDPSEKDQQARDDEVSGEGAAEAPAKRRMFPKTRAFLKEFKDAFGEKERRNPRRGWIIAGACVLVTAGALAVYLRGATVREIKSLMDAGQYAPAAELAQEYLSEHFENDEVRTLATEALIKDTAPKWTTQLEAGEFEAAASILDQARGLARSNEEALALLDLLGQIGDIQAFVTGRGGVDAPILIYVHEERMNALLEAWEQDRNANRRLIGLALNYVPELEGLYSQALSHVRKLRNEKSVYLPAIVTLKTTIGEKVAADDTEALGGIFREFQEKYPKIEGVAPIEQEWKRYLAVRNAVSEQEFTEATNLIDKAEFRVEPFRASIEKLKVEALPPKETTERYRIASAAWREGKLTEAIGILEQLRDGPWGASATAELVRKQNLAQKYESLKKAKSSAQYPERLLAFVRLLDPEEDSYFLQSLQDDFQRYKKRALSEAQEVFITAEKRWNQYQDDGGIGGLQRLEGRISTTFKRQAKSLSDAHDHVQRGVRIHELLKEEYAPKWKTLYEKISAETKLQRRSLEELRIVLSPSLLETKLELIPDPNSAEQTD
jgi:pSer/pThr/pTyr-binding forkhead associated (FHA) protein